MMAKGPCAPRAIRRVTGLSVCFRTLRNSCRIVSRTAMPGSRQRRPGAMLGQAADNAAHLVFAKSAERGGAQNALHAAANQLAQGGLLIGGFEDDDAVILAQQIPDAD